MGDESSSDDLLIDVDEEDFALTAEELEKAEELLEVKTEAKGVKARQGMSNDLKLMEEKLDSKLETVNGAAPEADIEARRNCEVTSDLASLLHSTPGPVALTSPTVPLYGGKSFSSEPSVKEKPNVDRGVVQINGLNHPMIIGSGGFTVKKVSRPGQQSFTFGKPSSQAPTPANQNVGMFTFGHSAASVGSTITSAPTAGSMQRSRDPRRDKLQGVAVQPRQIPGLSSTSASTSALSPQVLRLSPAQHQGNDSKISGGKALQRMGPSALERMAAEQERKCREENAKKEQLEKMVALKKAKAGAFQEEAKRLEEERNQLEEERRRLEEEKVLVATQKKVVELQEELMKLKQEKSGLSHGGAGNSKPTSERVGKKDVRERVGGGLRRRSDMSVKERVGEARRQAPSIGNINGFSGDQLSLCSDRFKEGLGETLQSHGSGNRAWNDEEKGDLSGHKKRKQTYKCKPLPEDLVLTELTDSGPVKKENFVKHAVAAKFSDESSEEDEDEDEEHGEVRKKRRW